jgi:integrase/recombinase XerD
VVLQHDAAERVAPANAARQAIEVLRSLPAPEPRISDDIELWLASRAMRTSRARCIATLADLTAIRDGAGMRRSRLRLLCMAMRSSPRGSRVTRFLCDEEHSANFKLSISKELTRPVSRKPIVLRMDAHGAPWPRELFSSFALLAGVVHSKKSPTGSVSEHRYSIGYSEARMSKINRAAVLTAAQIRHLLRVTEVNSRHPERDAVVLLLGHATGLRISESAQVTVADICFANGRLRQEVSLRSAITKGCRQRCVYVTSERLIAAIERYIEYRIANGIGTTLEVEYRGLEPHQPLVMSRRGYRFALNRKRRVSDSGDVVDYWAADSLQSYVTRLYQAAGLPGSSHSGRRSFASKILAKTGDLEVVARLLGHADIDMAQRYVEVDACPENLQFLADNGGAYRAHETHAIARQLGITPIHTPVCSPQSNGMAESFVNTLKRGLRQPDGPQHC